MDTSSSEPAAWLVQTKLYPPRLRDDIVFRPRLHNALKQALNNYPLTLITAPPGYGKTTLLATLCRHKDDEAGGRMKTEKVLHPSSLSPQPFNFAWLSLDEDDNPGGRDLA